MTGQRPRPMPQPAPGVSSSGQPEHEIDGNAFSRVIRPVRNGRLIGYSLPSTPS